MRSRKLARRLGMVIAVSGVALLAWVAVVWMWGDPITGAYTRWEQRKLAAEYSRLVDRYPTPPPVRTTQVAIDPAVVQRQRQRAATRFRKVAETGGPIGRIKVGKLGLNMVFLNGTDEGTLKKGPGRDPRTYMPGQGELVYIAGHRTTYGAPFAHIDRLRAGDPVVLEMPYGRFEYRVTRWVIVPADDLARLRSRGREQLALQACHPRFSANQRYIVYAVPVRGS
jgi:sortase A